MDGIGEEMEEEFKKKIKEFIDDVDGCGLTDCACSLKDKATN